MAATPVLNWYDLGWTDYLNGQHMPDRKCRIYPTRDQYSEEDERQFLAGWRAAKADDAAKATDMVELEQTG